MLAKSINTKSQLNLYLKNYTEDIIIEKKYDGQRSQLHFKKNYIEGFSRNLEKQKIRFPELFEKIFKKFEV